MARTGLKPTMPAAVDVAFEDTLDEATWSSLAARARPVLGFLAHGWWRAWANAKLPYDSWRGPLRLVVARDGNGTVQAAMPVAEQTMAGLTVLSLAGNYKPFRSLLIAEDAPSETADALVRFLTAEARPRAFRLGPLQAEAPETRSLRRALSLAGWRCCRISQGTEFIMDIPHDDQGADLEAYRTKAGVKRFQRIRYKRNRLARQGTLHSRRYRGETPKVWRQAIADAAAIERASWLPRLGGDFTFADPDMAAFWQGYLEDAQASRATSIWILYLKDRPVSFHAVIDSGASRYLMALAYDEAFKSYSPGKIIAMDSLITAFDENIQEFNMGQGDSGYKARLGADRTSRLDDWLALPPTQAGRLLHLAARLKFRSTA